MAKTAIQITALALLAAFGGGAATAETIVRTGKTAAGETCKVSVEKKADGSIVAAGGSSTTGSSGTLSSSSSAGGSSVNVQAGGGHVSSSSSVAGGPGAATTSTITVNGCTISTSSP